MRVKSVPYNDLIPTVMSDDIQDAVIIVPSPDDRWNLYDLMLELIKGGMNLNHFSRHCICTRSIDCYKKERAEEPKFYEHDVKWLIVDDRIDLKEVEDSPSLHSEGDVHHHAG